MRTIKGPINNIMTDEVHVNENPQQSSPLEHDACSFVIYLYLCKIYAFKRMGLTHYSTFLCILRDEVLYSQVWSSVPFARCTNKHLTCALAVYAWGNVPQCCNVGLPVFERANVLLSKRRFATTWSIKLHAGQGRNTICPWCSRWLKRLETGVGSYWKKHSLRSVAPGRLQVAYSTRSTVGKCCR
jgi:hypothetical protein